jgi:DNA-binding response OmpR family regulator
LRRILASVTSRDSQEKLRAGSLEVTPGAYTARATGRVVPLTPREFELLVELMRRPHEVLSRELLYELCRGHPMTTSDRTVDVYVRKLRAKLDHAAPEWRFIHTHYRLGYRFSPEPVEPSSQDDRSTPINADKRSVL